MRLTVIEKLGIIATCTVIGWCWGIVWTRSPIQPAPTVTWTRTQPMYRAHYYVVDEDGKVVDETWGFRKSAEGMVEKWETFEECLNTLAASAHQFLGRGMIPRCEPEERNT